MRRGPIVSIVLSFTVYIGASAQATLRAPRIWDDAALADWATPVAGLNVRPAHYSSAEYYGSPVDNLQTYPFYPVDREPAGYWDWLQKQKPKPLVEVNEPRTAQDWISAGEHAFREMDAVLVRSKDPELIARARDPRSLQGVQTQPDGSFAPLRWVVTPDGLMLSGPACAACHAATDPGRRAESERIAAGSPSQAPSGGGRRIPLTGAGATTRRLLQFYTGDSPPLALWKEFSVPWAPDERIERMKTMTVEELQTLNERDQLARSFTNGMFARANGSPYYATRVLDLQTLRLNRYMDVTATHRLRGPEDVARYAALVTGADRMDFGPYRILTDAQRRVRFHYADEVLYAIGMYLMSLEPPRNPNPASGDVVPRGEGIFRREGCAKCHVPPNYTSGNLTPAHGWEPPADHANRADILLRSVGTDSGVALRTRKGTGLYRIPSLRGVWYRRFFLHDGSLTSLEELFDPARLAPGYQPKGWNPPAVTTRAIPGHAYGLDLDAREKVALLAFLRSL